MIQDDRRDVFPDDRAGVGDHGFPPRIADEGGVEAGARLVEHGQLPFRTGISGDLAQCAGGFLAVRGGGEEHLREIDPHRGSDPAGIEAHLTVRGKRAARSIHRGALLIIARCPQEHTSILFPINDAVVKYSVEPPCPLRHPAIVVRKAVGRVLHLVKGEQKQPVVGGIAALGVVIRVVRRHHMGHGEGVKFPPGESRVPETVAVAAIVDPRVHGKVAALIADVMGCVVAIEPGAHRAPLPGDGLVLIRVILPLFQDEVRQHEQPPIRVFEHAPLDRVGVVAARPVA